MREILLAVRTADRAVLTEDGALLFAREAVERARAAERERKARRRWGTVEGVGLVVYREAEVRAGA